LIIPEINVERRLLKVQETIRKIHIKKTKTIRNGIKPTLQLFLNYTINFKKTQKSNHRGKKTKQSLASFLHFYHPRTKAHNLFIILTTTSLIASKQRTARN
jgi:hypothetical protein